MINQIWMIIFVFVGSIILLLISGFIVIGFLVGYCNLINIMQASISHKYRKKILTQFASQTNAIIIQELSKIDDYTDDTLQQRYHIDNVGKFRHLCTLLKANKYSAEDMKKALPRGTFGILNLSQKCLSFISRKENTEKIDLAAVLIDYYQKFIKLEFSVHCLAKLYNTNKTSDWMQSL